MYKSIDSSAFAKPCSHHCFPILVHFIPPGRNAILVSSLVGLDGGLPQRDLIIQPFIWQTFIAHLPRLQAGQNLTLPFRQRHARHHVLRIT